MHPWKGKSVVDDHGNTWPDIEDPLNWEAPDDETYTSLALPGPPLTQEQLLEAIREGDESGICGVDPLAEVLAERQSRRQGQAAA